MLYITGHKNPDTDSIVSAIVMKDYFKRLGQKAEAVRVGKINKETEFVLGRIKIKPPILFKGLAKKTVFLVDHNTLEESCLGVEAAKIVGVLDHHKLGGIKSDKPIYFRIEPVGSTSTLIFKLFSEKNFSLDKKQAFLLLCGILSDTLKFTSPTTTKEDIKIAENLAKICGQKINSLAQDLFSAKSDISGLKIKDIVFGDYKDFKKGSVKFGIGVCETLKPDVILEKKEEILKILNGGKQKRRLDLIFFGIVDIIKKQTYFLLCSNKEIFVAQNAFRKKEKKNLILLEGVVSRKSQILPAISNVL